MYTTSSAVLHRCLHILFDPSSFGLDVIAQKLVYGAVYTVIDTHHPWVMDVKWRYPPSIQLQRIYLSHLQSRGNFTHYCITPLYLAAFHDRPTTSPNRREPEESGQICNRQGMFNFLAAWFKYHYQINHLVAIKYFHLYRSVAVWRFTVVSTVSLPPSVSASECFSMAYSGTEFQRIQSARCHSPLYEYTLRLLTCFPTGGNPCPWIPCHTTTSLSPFFSAW